MKLPDGVKVRKNNKTYQGEIPDGLLSKKQLEVFGKKSNTSNKGNDPKGKDDK